MIGSGRRRDHDPAAKLVLARPGRRANLAKVDSEFAIEVAQSLERAVDVDRRIMAPASQLHHQPLRLAERISADQDAALRIFVQTAEQPVDLGPGLGMAEDRKAECGFGDENVARHRLEGRARRVRAALVVARNHDPLPPMLEDDLGGAEDMAGGNERDLYVTDPAGLAIADLMAARLGSVTAFHDRQRFGRRPYLPMAAAGVVAMAVRDQRARLGLAWIDPGVGGLDVETFGEGLDPGTEAGHRTLYGSAVRRRQARGKVIERCGKSQSGAAMPTKAAMARQL